MKFSLYNLDYFKNLGHILEVGLYLKTIQRSQCVTYLVFQKELSDLYKVLLGEDQTYITNNVWQQSKI